MRRTTIIILGSLVAALTIALSIGGVASAAAAGARCPPPPTASTPFATFADNAEYVLANNGSFDPLSPASKDSPWTLSHGASIVNDGDPWNLAGSKSAQALSLPAASSAVSACTTAPLIKSIVRFVVRSTGNPNGHLHVEMLVNGGKDGILDGGTITAGSTWSLTQPILIPWAHPLNGAVQLQVRLTPVEPDASFVVDDVYIDPFCSR